MSFLNPEVTYHDDNIRNKIPSKLLDFLRSLNGLTVIDIKGKDTSRTRVVTTLIHGNEPSGLIACHLWLSGNSENWMLPATNIRIIICNPEAAKSKPFFTNRYVQHSDDLNRFFATKNSNRLVALRAQNIMRLVKDVSPEAIVDLHNTSGISPAFCVSINDDLDHRQLVELFTNRLILTQINVGAVMEQNFNCPIVTIECGGANENSSHQIASNGLLAFFSKESLFSTSDADVQVLKNPLRIELCDDASVGFSNHRLTTTDITLRADIEELNQGLTPCGEFIGWCEADIPLQVEAIDTNGINQIDTLFEKRAGRLFTKKEMQLFMVTTVPEIATKDCLFYTTLR